MLDEIVYSDGSFGVLLSRRSRYLYRILHIRTLCQRSFGWYRLQKIHGLYHSYRKYNLSFLIQYYRKTAIMFVQQLDEF